MEGLLKKLTESNIKIDFVDEKLDIQAPKGVMTQDLLNEIKSHKEELIAFFTLYKAKKEKYQLISKAPEQSSYVLSSSQQRLWFLSQFDDGSTVYNMTSVLELNGNLSIPHLESAFNVLVGRHESLRTVFKEDDGEVRQVILNADESKFQLQLVDLSNGEVSDQKVKEIVEEEISYAFDLSSDSLVRVKLIKKSSDTYIFISVMHHIISDGWSTEVMTNELFALYDAFTKGNPSPLPALELQYKDFAEWQQYQLKNDSTEKHKTYWLQKFSGELPVLDLPVYQSRPTIRTYKGKSVKKLLDKALVKKFKGLCQSQDSTLFMGLLAVVKVLFFRYTNQKDIILGSPIAGREHLDLQNQIGFYVNTLCLRTQFGANDNFKELLSNIKEVTLGAYEHQIYPYDALVEQLPLKKDMSRNPLFDVMITLQNTDELKVSINGSEDIVIKAYEAKGYDDEERAISKVDIEFIFEETEEGFNIVLLYNTAIYSEDFIVNMLGHFEVLMQNIVAHPEFSISLLDYLTEKEIHQLLFDFNDTEMEYPKDKTIIDLFESQVKLTPHNIAIVFEEKKITYKELNEKSNQLAHYLRVNYAIQSDDLVGVKLSRSEQMIVALLGILKSGAAYVPVDPNYPQERIAYIEKESNSKTILDEKALAVFNEVQDQYSKSNIESKNQPHDLAYVIYTSGTTGNPKGVMVEHRNAVNFLYGMDNSIFLNEKEHLLAITSISFDISILELFWTLTRGITITLKADNTSLNNLNLFLKDYPQELDFSLFYFSSQNDSNDDKYKFLKESACYADKNDFSAIWLPERHFHEFGGIFPNPSVLGAGLATITDTIEIRSGSVVLPLHDVVRVAEEWSVVDNLSNGRVALSIASGWHADDFVLSPKNYSDRQEIMYSQIEQLKTLWQGESITRKNGLDQEIDFKIYPKPVNRNLDIYITSSGNPETFKNAGKIGANILTHLLGQEISDLANNIRIYKQALVENGFSAENAKISLMLHTYVGTDLDEVKDKVKAPFKLYLKSSVGLIKKLAKELDKDILEVSENNLDDLLELAFERYWQTAALLGTQDSCKKILSEIHSIGVTEIACLIDFGIADKEVLDGLENLTKLKNNYKKEKLDYSNRNPITSMQITPSYLEALLEDDSSTLFLKSLKNIIVGGEKFSVELLNKLRACTNSEIYNMYGPTETTIWSTFQKAQEDSVLNIGKPIQNTQIYILDDNKRICATGVKGELCIGGEGLARGYHKDEKLTGDKFIDFSFLPTINKRVYKTGDLARWLPNGTLEHLGRLDNQVKINGFRIELGEIESVLLGYESVTQAVVIALQNENTNKSLVAYFISNEEIEAYKFREYIAIKLPHYMIPNHFVRLKEFPLTPNGKIDRKSLPDISGETIVRKDYIAPRNETEEKLAEIWQEVLGIEKIGITDNFFELGGQSLGVMRLINIIEKKFSVKLTIPEFFANPKIESISLLIDPLKLNPSNKNRKSKKII